LTAPPDRVTLDCKKVTDMTDVRLSPRYDIAELEETSSRAVWAGTGAEALGLTGVADPADLAEVFSPRAAEVFATADEDLIVRYREIHGHAPDHMPPPAGTEAARDVITQLWLDGLL
jgi:hypothetical protein